MPSDDQLVRGGDRVVCRECGSPAPVIGRNPVGRPIRKCENGHTQVGPFASRPLVAADGGEQR